MLIIKLRFKLRQHCQGTHEINIIVADGAQIIRDRLIRQINVLPGVSNTYQAADLPSLIECAKMVRPGIILLDMFLPGGSGLAALRRLQEDRVNSQTIVLSSSAHGRLREHCLAAGAAHYFLKSSEFLKALDVVGAIVAATHGQHGDRR